MMTTGITNLGDRSTSVLTTTNGVKQKAEQPQSNKGLPENNVLPVASVVSTNVSTNSTTQEVEETAKAKPNLEEVTEITERLNENFQRIQRGLNFSVDDTLGDIVIKVIDQDTKEIIRQIPSEEMLSISKNIEEFNSLLFEDIKA